MINFRYHVVSLTAVFLALAIGLVVGTAALNGPVADSLNDNVNGLRKDNKQLRENLVSLQNEVQREEDFAIEAAPIILAGKLTDRRIAVVTLPSGRDHAEGVIDMLGKAGAKVVGRVDVQDKFVDPDKSLDMLELARKTSSATVASAGLPNNTDGIETSSALLAAALLDRPAPMEEADRRAVLNAYNSDGYIGVAEKVTGPAEAMVVVAGLPYVDRDSVKKDKSVITMVGQFDRAGPLVVAGSGAGDGNVVAGVRGDPALAKTISTVDNVSTAHGQIVTALATAEQVTQSKAGQYGLADGATSLVPKRPE